jgi:orotidine-5'-phosphate decarboxylase
MESDAAASGHVADRLLAAIDQLKAPVCVGIDPVLERLPQQLRCRAGTTTAAAAAAIGDFARSVLEVVAGRVPCVKFQSACFERYRAQGVEVLFELIEEAQARGLEVILDAKRGDIGLTAEHYAAGVFGAPAPPHWITVNSYLGPDAIEPFLAVHRGAFALVRTSNPGADAVQAERLRSGGTVAESVARMLAALGARCTGRRGYSALGAVVAATRPDEARMLRALMPQQLFLVPGLGPQGGTIEDVLPCFKPDGTGAVVTASRSVIFAFDSSERRWSDAVGRAASDLAEQVGRAVGLR